VGTSPEVGDVVDDVAPGKCSRPVSALTCVAGNGGVRSSWNKPTGSVPSGVTGGAKAGRVSASEPNRLMTPPAPSLKPRSSPPLETEGRHFRKLPRAWPVRVAASGPRLLPASSAGWPCGLARLPDTQVWAVDRCETNLEDPAGFLIGEPDRTAGRPARRASQERDQRSPCERRQR
jgi:hypothetical protein